MGTGTRCCAELEGSVLCLCSALSMVYSRSIWCAVLDRSCPAGFLRNTNLLELVLSLEQTHAKTVESTYTASVRKYVGFDYVVCQCNLRAIY